MSMLCRIERCRGQRRPGAGAAAPEGGKKNGMALAPRHRRAAEMRERWGERVGRAGGRGPEDRPPGYGGGAPRRPSCPPPPPGVDRVVGGCTRGHLGPRWAWGEDNRPLPLGDGQAAVRVWRAPGGDEDPLDGEANGLPDRGPTSPGPGQGR